MAIPWIRVEVITPDKPEVDGVAEILKISDNAALGALVRLWIWCDVNSVDGNALSVTFALLDRVMCAPGMCEALVKVGWMTRKDGVISIPHYDRHNGKSTKARGLSAIRAERFRSKKVKRKSNARSVTPSISLSISKSTSQGEGSVRGEVEIPGELDTPSFRAAWSDWLTHRKQIKKPVTELAAKKQLKALAKRGTHDAIRAIEHSIANGWQGIFDPDERTGRAAARTSRVEAEPRKYEGRPGSEFPAPGQA